MKKRRLFAAAGLAALGFAGYKYMEMVKDREALSKEELDEYFDTVYDLFGLPDLGQKIEEDWIENNGLKLHLDLYLSDPSDPALVFIPGTSFYARLYAAFLYEMSLTGLNVIGLDPHGHGQSEGVRGSYTIDELVSDAKAVTDYAIERFGDNVAIMGSSQGGMVAFYAAASDERLKASVCHNLAVMDEPELVELMRWPRAMALLRNFVFLLDLLPELKIPVYVYLFSVGLDIKTEPIKFEIDTMEFFENDPLVVPYISSRALASIATVPPAKPVEEIKVPVMIVQGEEDSIFPPSYTKGIFDRLTCEKEYLMMEGQPHLVLHNNVEEVVPEISAWLNRFLRPA